MELKFECPHCGQHLLIPQELLGTTLDCPTCAKPIELPTRYVWPKPPPAPPPPPLDAAKMAARIRGQGYDFTVPADMETKDLENALDEFLHAGGSDDFEDTLFQMEAERAIRDRPTEAQLMAIGNRLLEKILAGDFGGTEPEVRKIILKIAPGLRA